MNATLPMIRSANSRRLMSGFLLRGTTLHPFRIQRKPRGEIRNVSFDFIPHLFRFRSVNDFCDQTSDLLHLWFFHAAGGDGGCADAQA